MTGKQVRAIRTQLKLTQQELADKVGVSRVSVARWENGSLGIRQSAALLLQLFAAQAKGVERDGEDRPVPQKRLSRK